MITVMLLALVPVAGQSPSATPPELRGPDGRPNLQGVWDFRTITPLERPETVGDEAFLSEEEAAVLEEQREALNARLLEPSDVNRAPREPGGGGLAVGGYNNFWLDFGTNVVDDRRTSLIVDPPNGRLPALAQGAPHQVSSLWEDLDMERPIRTLSAGTRADGPEYRGLAERCLAGFNTGPPMTPSGYNNHMQLFQTADHVGILNEMVHDVRIIPLDGRPPLPSHMRQWMGSSRGHWEGDTLVVTTTNVTDKMATFSPNVLVAMGTGATLTLTERFQRVDADTLLYEFTVEDPTTFTAPFTAVVPMHRSDEPVFEYACHEGNYGLLNILRGARDEEQAARDASGQQ